MDLQRPDYAYMFGFLQADGHLAQGTGNKGRLTVEISVRDIAVLHAFQRLTPYNTSITERVRATNFSEEHHSAIWTLCDQEARATVNGPGISTIRAACPSPASRRQPRPWRPGNDRRTCPSARPDDAGNPGRTALCRPMTTPRRRPPNWAAAQPPAPYGCGG
ncbi:hypothetical protein ACWEIM_24045 [Streptomyces sp. NPDC004778]